MMSNARADGCSGLLTAAVALGIVLPPTALPGGSIIMPLCDGGGIAVTLDPKGKPLDEQRGCHVTCTLPRKTRDVDPHPEA